MNEIFVARLKYLIQREDISQKDLANDVGITESAMSRYMSGERIPHGETLKNLAVALRTNADYLLGNSNIENSQDNLNFDEITEIIARSTKEYSNEEIEKLISIIKKNNQ